MLAPIITSDHERLIFDVPVSVIEEHKNFSSTSFWSGKFNSSLWIKFPRGLWKNITLQIKYLDKDRVKTILVDRCSGNGQNLVLLNGCSDISCNGKIKALGLYIKGLDKNDIMKTEESIFSPKEKKSDKKQQNTNANLASFFNAKKQ